MFCLHFPRVSQFELTNEVNWSLTVSVGNYLYAALSPFSSFIVFHELGITLVIDDYWKCQVCTRDVISNLDNQIFSSRYFP